MILRHSGHTRTSPSVPFPIMSDPKSPVCLTCVLYGTQYISLTLAQLDKMCFSTICLLIHKHKHRHSCIIDKSRNMRGLYLHEKYPNKPQSQCSHILHVPLHSPETSLPVPCVSYYQVMTYVQEVIVLRPCLAWSIVNAIKWGTG